MLLIRCTGSPCYVFCVGRYVCCMQGQLQSHLSQALGTNGPGLDNAPEQAPPGELKQLLHRVALLEAELADSEKTHELRYAFK